MEYEKDGGPSSYHPKALTIDRRTAYHGSAKPDSGQQGRRRADAEVDGATCERHAAGRQLEDFSEHYEADVTVGLVKKHG